MAKLKIPRSVRSRLKEVGRANGYKSWDDFGLHLVERGLRQYEGDEGSGELSERLEDVVDRRGYSSQAELVEHLLERGLGAYDVKGLDRESFEERLRGLGYID
jgi:hypothetical protein